jgi:hypothetical protein
MLSLRSERLALQLFVLRNRIAGFRQRPDHAVDARLLVVEIDCERVGVHVGLDVEDPFDILDGYTSRLGRAASDDARCTEEIADRFRECGARQHEHQDARGQSKGSSESLHDECLRMFQPVRDE